MALAMNTSTAFVSAATTNGNHAVTDADSYYEHTFWVRITGGTATVTITGSADGTNYDAVATAITASDIIYVTGAHPYLRLEISSISGATINADLVQFGSHPTRGR